MKLSDLGEIGLISQLFQRGHIHGGKEDCVVLRIGKKNILLSTDSVSYLTNLPRKSTPAQIGQFLASINLSDIAAMAGNPLGMLASFLVSKKTDSEFVEKIVEAADLKLREFGAEYLGGDSKEGHDLEIAGTIIGEQDDKLLRRRSDIRKGQLVGITGTMGRGAAGYVFFKSGYRVSHGINLMMSFIPRIKEARIISELGGKFMTDLSDGINGSITRAKRDFGVGFRIVEDEIPLDANVAKASQLSGETPTNIAMNYGGDYEIMFTIDNTKYSDFKAAMESEHIKASFIGDTWEGGNILFDGAKWNNIAEGGYEHFRVQPKIGKIE